MTDDAHDALPEPDAAEPTNETTGSTAADTPTEAVTPPADTPAPAAPEPPTVEAPAAAAGTAEIPTTPAPATAVPVAAAPVAAEPAKRSGITVPTWVAALIGAAIVFALGFGIGYGVGDDHDGGGNRAVQSGPGFGMGRNGNGFNGQMPNGPQFGNGGNGQMPFGRNGNGNGNGNGSGSGSTTATVFLGVAAQDSTNPDGAALVRVVAGSPAADAGLKTGDVITKFDGESIASASDLTAAVHSQKAGATVTITYTRDGQSDTAEATLAGSSDFSRQ